MHGGCGRTVPQGRTMERAGMSRDEAAAAYISGSEYVIDGGNNRVL